MHENNTGGTDVHAIPFGSLGRFAIILHTVLPFRQALLYFKHITYVFLPAVDVCYLKV